MTDFKDYRMYFGATSGSARKALRHAAEPHALLNAVSDNNTAWDGLEDVFVDSGGYSMMSGGATDYAMTPDEYLDFVEKVDADRFVLRDYPCEPDLRDNVGRSTRDHQDLTVEQHIATLDAAEDRGIDAEPLAVVQGWDESEYLHHVDMLADHGLLTDTVGVGSICRRGATGTIRQILKRVATALPSGTGIHAFGVKRNVLNDMRTRQIIESADTCAWYFRSYQGSHPNEPTWHGMLHQYLEYKRELYDSEGVEPKAGQATLGQSIMSADGGTPDDE